jgi:hypothetical protein
MNSSGGAGAARETMEIDKRKSGGYSLVAKIRRSCRLVAAALAEIFDESAYGRFLDRAELQSSVSAYAAFQKENEQVKARRPRCC